jgi:hypothetical protein
MFFNGFDEFPDRLQATSKSSGHPTHDKPFCGPGRAEKEMMDE